MEHVQSTAEAVGNEDIPFIDLIVCPSYSAAYNDEALKEYGMDKRNYRSKGSFKPQNYTAGTNLRNIFESITYDPAELIHNLNIRTLDKKKDSFFIDFGGTNINEHIEIITKYWSTYGRCYSIRPRDHILKLGVEIVDINSQMDIYVYFGYPGQFHYKTKTKVCVGYVRCHLVIYIIYGQLLL